MHAKPTLEDVDGKTREIWRRAELHAITLDFISLESAIEESNERTSIAMQDTSRASE